MFDSETIAQYRALKDDAVGYVIKGSIVRVTGGDRLRFLHNFCTNEIKQLPARGVCEAFILDGKGKILHHVHVLNGADALWLHSVADDADPMIEHLDKYLLRDDVQMKKVTDREATFVAGAKSESALSPPLTAALPENHLIETNDGTVIANLELAGWGYLVLSENSNAVPDAIEAVGEEAFHAIRIERRTPWMGFEIDDSNLPQELLRDDQCINFNKGCYLGQETVARIDAIGRVNRVIAYVESDQSLPAATELIAGEKTIGKITSSTWSPDQQKFIASAIVRRPHEKLGTELSFAAGSVTVI